MVNAGPAITLPPLAGVVLVALMSARHALMLYSGSWVLMRDRSPSDGPSKADFAQVFDRLRKARSAVWPEPAQLEADAVREIVSALVSARQVFNLYEGAVIVSDGPQGQEKLHFGKASKHVKEALAALGVALDAPAHGAAFGGGGTP